MSDEEYKLDDTSRTDMETVTAEKERLQREIEQLRLERASLQIQQVTSAISLSPYQIRDVESTLLKFQGDDVIVSVEQWIAHIEEDESI